MNVSFLASSTTNKTIALAQRRVPDADERPMQTQSLIRQGQMGSVSVCWPVFVVEPKKIHRPYAQNLGKTK
jgi:hypothetical protein